MRAAKPNPPGFRFSLQYTCTLRTPAGMVSSQLGSSACRVASSLVGLLIAGTPALTTARPPSVQKSQGNEANISSLSPRSKRA